MRAEIRLAERLGVSPRRLWGWEPETRLIPDESGGFIVEKESEFSTEDIEMFEAARLAEESISPRGIEWVDELNPANQYRFHVGDEKGLPSKNYAIAAQEKAKKAYQSKYSDADMSAFVWPVQLKDQ